MGITLSTTTPQFDGLHDAVARARTATTQVTVSRAALAALLIDHGRALAALRQADIEVDEPDYQAEEHEPRDAPASSPMIPRMEQDEIPGLVE